MPARWMVQGEILLVTAGVNESDVPNLIRKGISGIFMKHGSPALLIQGIREAMDGKALFDQKLLRRGLESADRIGEEQTRARLTERERSVLSFIFEGLSNKQISDRLQISESAVKASLQQLFTKTGVRTRSQLVRIALEQYRDELKLTFAAAQSHTTPNAHAARKEADFSRHWSEPLGVGWFCDAHPLRERSRKVERKKGQRYSGSDVPWRMVNGIRTVIPL